MQKCMKERFLNTKLGVAFLFILTILAVAVESQSYSASNCNASAVGKEFKNCSSNTTARLTEPRDFKVFKNAPKKLDLRWTKPAETNGTVSGYVLDFVPGNPNGKRVMNQQTPTTRYVIEELTSWMNYSISVRAYHLNPTGNRTEGPKAFTQVQTSISAPSPPENVLAQLESGTNLHLTWDRPLELNGVLDGYLLYLDNQFLEDLPGGASSHQISGLRQETHYTIKMEAYNKDRIKRFVSKPTTVNFETTKSGSSKSNFANWSIVVFSASFVWNS